MTLVSFTPPTRNEFSDDRFWGRFGMPTGISIVWNGTAFVESPIPWLGELEPLEHNPLTGISEGYRWFRGGCTYLIDEDLANQLIADGFDVDLGTGDDGGWTTFDLGGAFLPLGFGSVAQAEWDGSVLKSTGTAYVDFVIPSFQLDGSTAYDFEFTFTDDGTFEGGFTSMFVGSLSGDDQSAYDSSSWDQLYYREVLTSPLVVSVGPGIESWAEAVGDGESFVIFEGSPGMQISRVRWRVTP